MTTPDPLPSPALSADEEEAAAALARTRNTGRLINGMLLAMGAAVLVFILYGLVDMAQVIINAR
jgi:hypothetical protein